MEAKRKMFWGHQPTKPKYVLIEEDRPLPPELLADYKRSVPGLAQSPGFLYLLGKLRLQKGRLLAQLAYVDHSDIKQVYRLQAGIFWAEWLEKQLKAETKAQASMRRSATSTEEENLRSIDSVEFVGEEKEHNS